MDITFASPLVKALQGKGIRAVDTMKSWSRDNPLTLDLTELSDTDIKTIQATMLAWPHEHDVKSLLRTIDFWLRAKNDRNMTVRTLQMLPAVFREWMKKVPGYRLYKAEKGAPDIWVPYVFTNAEFHPARSSDDKDTATITLHYWEQGKVESQRHAFDWLDVRGKNVAQLLAGLGYVPETQDLRDANLRDAERYLNLRPQVGLQMLATGLLYGTRYGGATQLLVDGKKSRLIIDGEKYHQGREEGEGERVDAPNSFQTPFWAPRHKDEKTELQTDEDYVEPQEDDRSYYSRGSSSKKFEPVVVELPMHPYVTAFEADRHVFGRVHVRNLTPYIYDKSLKDKLVLPEAERWILDTLLGTAQVQFNDIIAGKAGGITVLSSGPPGTGKTLTAEVCAEEMERPLLKVASHQLGLTAEQLEKNLAWWFKVAARWGALLLLDEADVYVHERGDDIHQNAIVGSMLRILEYYSGLLFMTTNRDDIVDDAILSRCTAHVRYGLPGEENQRRIWRILADVSGVKALTDEAIVGIASRHPDLSGRDVKMLLKLCAMVHARTKEPIDVKMVEKVLPFRPALVTVAAEKGREVMGARRTKPPMPPIEV